MLIVVYSLQRLSSKIKEEVHIGGSIPFWTSKHTYTAGCSWWAFHPWHFDWTPQFLQSEQGDKGSDLEGKITQSER